MGNIGVPLHIRFWQKVNKGLIDDCWLWVGAVKTNKGKPSYGHIRREHRGKHVMAHVLSWEFVHGAIPAGMECVILVIILFALILVICF